NRRQRNREIFLERDELNYIREELDFRGVRGAGAIGETGRLPSLDTQQHGLVFKRTAEKIGMSIISSTLSGKLKASIEAANVGVIGANDANYADILIRSAG